MASKFTSLIKFTEVKAHRVSDSGKAILCTGIVEGKETWVPTSQIDDDSEVFKDGDEGDLIVNEWWAVQAKLESYGESYP